jgi:hypothetical protein
MNFSLKNKIVVVGLLAMLLAGFGVYMTTLSPNNSYEGNMEMRYVADFSDDRNVIGFAGNVFAGKITKVLKHTESDKLPVTLYEVEVVDNIKGTLDGSVTIMDIVGYSLDNEGEEKLTSINGIDTLMQPGEVYLFATNHDEAMTKQEGFDVFSLGGHPNFKKKLNVDGSLDIGELEVVVKQSEEVKAWEDAYDNENTEMKQFIDTKTINRQ